MQKGCSAEQPFVAWLPRPDARHGYAASGDMSGVAR